MQYYRSTLTGKILTEGSVRVLNDIYGDGSVDEALQMNKIEPIDNPDIIDCIRYGCGSTAVFRYRELHPDANAEEAVSAVKQIRKDMRWIRKIKK